MRTDRSIVNALTIDVEDYFQVSAFAPFVQRDDWDRCECRVERNVDKILEILDQYRARATFFTLGWVADRYPLLARRIVDGGHELASHGYSHRRATEQSRDDFVGDISWAKKVLEDASGAPVLGYRAPSFSVGTCNQWALEAIAEAGYKYSSSIYPVRHDHYGWESAPRFAFRPSAALLEIPVSTVRLASRNWPAGGGGFFRLLPYVISRWAIAHINECDKQPAVFYFHPWELDPGQPRLDGLNLKTRFRHYVNLSCTETRLRRLLSDFLWDRADSVFLARVVL